MATTQTTAATPAKALTVADDMDSRRVFATAQDAAAYLNSCAERFPDFLTTPRAMPGIDEEGNFDASVYTDGMEIMIAKLRKAKGGIKAIVVAPVPTLDSLLADDTGRAWVQSIIHKELNHVAVRPLREAEDIAVVVDQMPTTRDAYISSARGDGGGIMETFSELYKQINATLAAKVPVWNKARLIKSDFKKALESRGYALEFYPSLENRGEGKDSLFVTALKLGIGAAKQKGLDPTIFERWMETRNAKAFDAAAQEDEDELDVDNLTDSLMAEDAKPAQAETPTEEAPEEQPTA